MTHSAADHATTDPPVPDHPLIDRRRPISPLRRRSVLLRGGTIMDGTGAVLDGDVAIRDGRIEEVSARPIPSIGFDEIVDVGKRWVIPGFIEVHSHYDGELLFNPGLGESVRHGVTSVVIGNCSLSTVASSPETCADLFARVEAIPHEVLHSALDERKEWTTPSEYRKWIEAQPLGPNVAAMLGHSDVRSSVLGLDRATSADRPSTVELDSIMEVVDDALDAGFLGVSTMTTTLDKVAGDVAWSRPLPSTFAASRERRALYRVLRRRRGVLQSAPNAALPLNLVGFLAATAGIGRPPLQTSLLTAMDLRSNPFADVAARAAAWCSNRLLRGDLRFQALPGPMIVRGDGLEFNSFEEFATGRVIQDLRDHDDRYALASEPEFRRRFERELGRYFVVGLWQRRIGDARVVDCPDGTLRGKTFAEIGRDQGTPPANAFLDLALQYREFLTWESTIGNHRPDRLRRILASPNVQIGFADSGAHLRGLAFYNFGLRALRLAVTTDEGTRASLSPPEMVRRCTGELADWFGLDTGYLRAGAPADVVVIDPAGLTDAVWDTHESYDDSFGVRRLVNRNDDAVERVLIGGHLAYSRDEGYSPLLGVEPMGSFFPSTRTR